jgi:hypothetical protein
MESIVSVIYVFFGLIMGVWASILTDRIDNWKLKARDWERRFDQADKDYNTLLSDYESTMLAPILDWYDSDEQHPRDCLEIPKDLIKDHIEDRKQLNKIATEVVTTYE